MRSVRGRGTAIHVTEDLDDNGIVAAGYEAGYHCINLGLAAHANVEDISPRGAELLGGQTRG